jgi:SAM-dependent methyltransferase
MDTRYEAYYAQRTGIRVYPTEFVVRIFLATYPGLDFKKPAPEDHVLDVGFGDGRNTAFLCGLGHQVSGVELTQGIVEQTRNRLTALGLSADLRVGRNSALPFEDASFETILACHSCYYCDEGESFADNLKEYARVLKPGGFLVASLACATSYIFQDATVETDGSMVIKSDPYGNRVGYRLHGFSTADEVEDYLSPTFSNFSIGFADNDYFGIQERVFWVVCQRS